MGRHAGTEATAPPDVQMTLGLPTGEQLNDTSKWEVGLCWLCGKREPVVWIGPVVLRTRTHGRERAPAYACEACLERLAGLVILWRHEHGL
jgi:hypothetical protein